MYAAIILQAHRKKLVLPDKWVQRKIQNRETKVFISKDENKPANFSLAVKYFQQEKDSVYHAIYLKSFGKLKLDFIQNITSKFRTCGFLFETYIETYI